MTLLKLLLGLIPILTASAMALITLIRIWIVIFF